MKSFTNDAMNVEELALAEAEESEGSDVELCRFSEEEMDLMLDEAAFEMSVIRANRSQPKPHDNNSCH